jgi:hypothetical protein
MHKFDVDVLRNHHVNVPIERTDEAELRIIPTERKMARRDNVYAAARIAERNFLELVDETPVDEEWFRNAIGMGQKMVRWGDIEIEHFSMDPDAGGTRNAIVVSLVIPTGPNREEDDTEEYTREVQALLTRGEALQFCNIIMGKKMVK